MISTALFIALNKEGVKTRFNCITHNAKLIQHQFIKSLVCQLGRIIHSEKKDKDVSIEHLKQTLSLRNQKRRSIMAFERKNSTFFVA